MSTATLTRPSYLVTLTEDELAIVRDLFPRQLVTKKAPAPRGTGVRRPAAVKPPTLPKGQFEKVSGRWADVVADPQKWHSQLLHGAGQSTNRPSERDVLRAWGLVA